MTIIKFKKEKKNNNECNNTVKTYILVLNNFKI